LIHDLIKPRKFNCVFAVSRGILSAFPRCAADFAKIPRNLSNFRGKLWAYLYDAKFYSVDDGIYFQIFWFLVPK